MVALAAVAVATAVAFVFHDRILDLLARPLPPGHRHVVGARRGRAVLGLDRGESCTPGSSSHCRCCSGRSGRSSLRRSTLRPSAGSSSSPSSASCSGRRGSRSATGSCSRARVHWLTSYDTTHFRLLVRASSYYSFVTSVLLGVVAVFETPLVVLAAVNLGILTSSRRCAGTGGRATSSSRRLALALPGPDPVTTMLELLPMWALFEGSIWLAVLAERRAAKLSLAGAAGMTPCRVEEARRLLGRSRAVARARLRPLPLLPAAQPGADGPRHARVHVRPAARVRRRPHRGDRQHDAEAPAGRQAPARHRLLLLARPLDDRLLAHGRARGGRRDGALAAPVAADVRLDDRRVRLGHVPLADRGAQPPRAARGRRRLPEHEARPLRRAEPRARARQPGLPRRVSCSSASAAGSTRAGRCIRSASCSGSASTRRPRSRCSPSPPASRRTMSRSSP